MRIGAVLTMSAFALLAAACSRDCVALCEDTQDEGCEALEGADCETVCEAAQDVAESAECTGTFDDWMSCLDGADDLCDAYKNECGSEGDRFEDCVSEYCDGREYTASCSDLEEAD